jgi:hypothetical protein
LAPLVLRHELFESRYLIILGRPAAQPGYIVFDQASLCHAILNLAEQILIAFEKVYQERQPVGIELAKAFSGVTQTLSRNSQIVKLFEGGGVIGIGPARIKLLDARPENSPGGLLHPVVGRNLSDFKRLGHAPPQKPRAASGGAGQTLPKTAKWRLFQLIFNWRRRAI